MAAPLWRAPFRCFSGAEQRLQALDPGKLPSLAKEHWSWCCSASSGASSITSKP